MKKEKKIKIRENPRVMYGNNYKPGNAHLRKLFYVYGQLVPL